VLPKPVRVSLSNAQDNADAAVDWYIGEGAFTAADDFADELDQASAEWGRLQRL
jgi:hypothetical protein